MCNKKKVLITIPSIRYGGQEKVAVNTAKLLSRYYDVTILVFFRCDKEIDANGITVMSCKEENLKGLKIFRRIKIMRKLKKQEQYHASISFSPGANLINVITKKRIKTLTSIRGYRSIFSASGKIKFLMRRTDVMVCVSEGIATKVQEYYKIAKEHVAVLYNPYNFEIIEQMGREAVDDYSFQGITICNVSHLNEVKGLEHLLRAFAVIHHRIPNTRLLVIGDGTMSELLLKLTHSLGLDERVTFIGYRDNPYKYIAKSDLYILTSENEGFPNSLVEAMLFVPVVSVNCETGPWEILAGEKDVVPCNRYEICKYGILTPPIQKTRNYASVLIEKEEQELARAVIELLENKDLYEGLKIAAYKRAHQFDEERYMERLIKLIED